MQNHAPLSCSSASKNAGQGAAVIKSQNGILRILLLAAVAGSGCSGGVQGAAAIKEGFATTSAGVRIHYLQSGDESSSRAIVLIPGWRLPAYLWNEQLVKFAGMNRVIAIDPRSQGESSKTADGNTPESRARDLQEILAQMKIASYVLVGWSQGAQDVSAYLQQFGTGSIAGIVLVDSPVSYGPAEVEMHKEFSKAILSNVSIYANHPQEFSEGMVQSIFAKPHPDLDLPKIAQSTLQTPTNTGIAMLIADIFGADRRPALAKLDKPTLVMASGNSPLLDVQKEMAASIPNAKLVVMPGTAHAVFVDDPATFDAALQSFLESLSDWSPGTQQP
jgi:non-heme chloroperoxidase